MAAKVQLSYARVDADGRAETGTTMPVTGAPISSDTLTTSASNQQFVTTAPDAACFGRIAVVGGPVYAAIGSDPSDTPDATASPRILIPEGGVHWFAPAKAGVEVSVVDA